MTTLIQIVTMITTTATVYAQDLERWIVLRSAEFGLVSLTASVMIAR